MLDEVLLLFLILGWAAVLLPGALKARRSIDPHVTVGGFEEAMAVLRNRPDGREILVPNEPRRIVGVRPAAHGAPAVRASASSRSLLRARRRELFTRLMGAVAGTGVLALLFGGILWTAFVLTLCTTGGYVALLRHFKLEADRARDVVRTIDSRRRVQAPTQGSVGIPQGYVQVATSPDDPWEPQSGVRIRRWAE